MAGSTRAEGAAQKVRQFILSVMEVPIVLDISYNSAFELFQQPDFPKFRLFQLYYVRIDRLYEWLVSHGLKSYCPQQWIDTFGKKL